MSTSTSFYSLPIDLQVMILKFTDLPEIQAVRSLGDFQELTEHKDLWKDIANRINYTIPKDIGPKKIYENVNGHIIDINNTAETLAPFVPEIKTQLLDKNTVDSIMKLQKEIYLQKCKDTLIIWQAIKRQIIMDPKNGPGNEAKFFRIELEYYQILRKHGDETLFPRLDPKAHLSFLNEKINIFFNLINLFRS